MWRSPTISHDPATPFRKLFAMRPTSAARGRVFWRRVRANKTKAQWGQAGCKTRRPPDRVQAGMDSSASISDMFLHLLGVNVKRAVADSGIARAATFGRRVRANKTKLNGAAGLPNTTPAR